MKNYKNYIFERNDTQIISDDELVLSMKIKLKKLHYMLEYLIMMQKII
jgi:hypothetical protein